MDYTISRFPVCTPKCPFSDFNYTKLYYRLDQTRPVEPIWITLKNLNQMLNIDTMPASRFELRNGHFAC